MPYSSDRTASHEPLRTVLICHVESRLNREAVASWMASFSQLIGMVLIEERGQRLGNRVRNEVRRIGWPRFLDVLAFRLYYAVALARRDGRWIDAALNAIAQRFGPPPPSMEVLRTHDPNSEDVREFLRRLAPDLAIARCKRILKPGIFDVPRLGTYVLHPGVCPEYRNAHGAFWALANDDLGRVGLTLLKIDAGVDTGPVYGYFYCRFDEVADSHIVVMTRLLLENLDGIRDRIREIAAGTAETLSTAGRASAVWGQPWLTSYLRWKRHARRRRDASLVARVP